MSRRYDNHRTARLVRLLPIVLILGACATGSIREKLLTLPVIDGATYVGAGTCAGCHEPLAAAMPTNTHGRLADFELMGAEKGCEGCHGAGSLHAESGDPTKILRFAQLAPDESAAICVKCHSSGKLFDWTHGEHALSEVGCSDCHTLHGATTARASLKQEEPELCYGCHQEQQAQARFPSHHPVQEGKMSCSSCHNAHGELQTEEQARDLCLDCHARHQGPFIFEHAPVQEDCSICHDPHGTVANNLLKQNEPFLCLQCHESHFHTGRIGATVDPKEIAFSAYNPDGTPATPPVVGTTPSANTAVPITNALGEHSWQMAFGTKCTVCHSEVHGSDLPSQTSPTIGTNGQGWPDGAKGLTR